MNRIQEISLEINKLIKKKSNSKKLESLQAELKELLIKKRVSPTLFQARNNSHKTAMKSNLVDIQKALAKKSAEEFSNEIKTGKLYKELKPEKAKS